MVHHHLLVSPPLRVVDGLHSLSEFVLSLSLTSDQLTLHFVKLELPYLHATDVHDLIIHALIEFILEIELLHNSFIPILLQCLLDVSLSLLPLSREGVLKHIVLSLQVLIELVVQHRSALTRQQIRVRPVCVDRFVNLLR